jgi:hypothetical protein
VSTVYKVAAIYAAQIAGESQEMDDVANELATLAKGFAAEHIQDGDFERSIHVERVRGKRGVTDRLVVADDPLAAAKELGHVIRNEPGGPDLGRVKGQHSMGKAVAAIGGSQ